MAIANVYVQDATSSLTPKTLLPRPLTRTRDGPCYLSSLKLNEQRTLHSYKCNRRDGLTLQFP